MQGNAGMSELKRTMKHDRNCVEFAGIAHQTTPGNGTESLFMSVPGLDGVGERWGPVGPTVYILPCPNSEPFSHM